MFHFEKLLFDIKLVHKEEKVWDCCFRQIFPCAKNYRAQLQSMQSVRNVTDIKKQDFFE